MPWSSYFFMWPSPCYFMEGEKHFHRMVGLVLCALVAVVLLYGGAQGPQFRQMFLENHWQNWSSAFSPVSKSKVEKEVCSVWDPNYLLAKKPWIHRLNSIWKLISRILFKYLREAFCRMSWVSVSLQISENRWHFDPLSYLLVTALLCFSFECMFVQTKCWFNPLSFSNFSYKERKKIPTHFFFKTKYRLSDDCYCHAWKKGVVILDRWARCLCDKGVHV